MIIPDVHGRKFWKNAVEMYPDVPVVFLGDYMDPYPQEGIDDAMALRNFREIMAYKQENPDSVVLLLGNHDMHYLSRSFARIAMGTRYSIAMQPVLGEMFRHNADSFLLAYSELYEDTLVLFTHAGVSSDWYHSHPELLAGDMPGCLNRLMDSDEGIGALGDIGAIRGGWSASGSVLWADVSEVMRDVALPEYYQIFGHTQQRVSPIVNRHFACLDCRRAFLLSEVMDKAQVPSAKGG